MLNFAVGPVQSDQEILDLGSNQVPYFRTDEFSKLMLENETYLKKFTGASQDDRVVFLTGSGTAAMEAAIINCLNKNDKALVINGGSFGQRFVELLKIHEIPYTEIKKEFGKQLTKEDLLPYENQGYSAFVLQICETSTGLLYDMDLVSDFCKRNNLFLIGDAISAFLAEDLNVTKLGIDVFLTGSQKALACPPGVSLLVLSKDAQKRIEENDCKMMYLNLKDALKNMERGQTPFTPAVSILIQIHERLKRMNEDGFENEINNMKHLAQYFRERIKDLPLDIACDALCNCVTSLHPHKNNAMEIFRTLKDEYQIWICPNGGELKDSIFRVGHMGCLTEKDIDTLIDAFNDLVKRGIM